MTEAQAIRLIGGLMAAYRVGQTITDDTADAYVEDILDLDFEPAALAVKTLRQTSKFLPSIAEIRQAAAEIHAGHLPDEDEAWAEVMANIRHHGWTGTPTWTHPAIHATVKAMGWRDLCASTNQVADRAHFLSLYRTQRARLERDRQIDPAIREMAALIANSMRELDA
jgi:hypothetical protein